MVYANDFIFDGVRLSSKGMIIGSLESNTTEEVQFGNIVLSTSKSPSSRLYRIYNKTDGEPITFNFNIVKESGEAFTSFEIGKIKRWLERDTYDWMTFYDGNKQITDEFYHGYFSLSGVRIGNEIRAFNVTFTNDSAYSYTNEIMATVDSSASKVIKNGSDATGYLYPKVVITCTGGDVEVKNVFDGKTVSDMKIRNVDSGTIVTVDCENKIITSSSSDSLASKFNYDFFKLCNNYTTTENTVTVSGGTAKIIYRELLERVI